MEGHADQLQQAQQQDQAPTETASQTAVAAAVTGSFKRPRGNRGNLRKRAEPDEQQAEDAAGSSVVRAAKTAKGEPLMFSNKSEGADEVHVTYESTRALPTGKDASVFRVLETETATDNDARALREAVLSQGKPGEPAQDDGKYHGMNSYIDYRAGFRREHTVAAEKGSGSHGPLRANMYVRMTAIMDYNPCICKDYKETGYCSYGDSCKFMHDRGDYKMSWELDRDWEAEQKKKLEERMRKMEQGLGSDEEGEGGPAEEPTDDLPFACFVCRKPWAEAKNPVVTLCRHYFCEACALKQQRVSAKCAVCEKTTKGVFNVAHDIIKKLSKMTRAADAKS